MWEIIKRVKGISLDQYDQSLNDMLLRTARDEIIPFDEWQGLVEDLDEEQENSSDIATTLRERGLNLPVLLKQADEARTAFLAALDRHGLPLEDRFKLCRLLYERVQGEPSDELLRLYCDIVCDGGFLLDIERGEDEGAVCWLYGKEDADELYDYLSERRQINSRTREILERAKETPILTTEHIARVSARADEVFQMYTQIFRSGRNQERLLDNISQFIQIADHSEELAPIKPLFLYRMLTRHGKRMQTDEEMKIDFRTLWNYQEYKFDQDNGKNYLTNTCYLELFSRLCDIFSSDQTVDMPVCVCGFEQLSNLSDFYWMLAPETFEIPFPPPMDTLLDESLFTCFEQGDTANVVMTDAGLSRKALERFQCSAERRISRALAQISDYMNERIPELIERFWGAAPDAVHALCSEILEASALPRSQQPRTAQETVLFLAAINGGLMEAVDCLAEEYLAAIGRIFVER